MEKIVYNYCEKNSKTTQIIKNLCDSFECIVVDINEEVKIKEKHNKAREHECGTIIFALSLVPVHRGNVENEEKREEYFGHKIAIDEAKREEEIYEKVKKEMEFLQRLEKVNDSIEELFLGEASGHDVWHSIRVFYNACKISNAYNCNWNVVALAALLHDTDDRKLFHTNNYENARKIMTACQINSSIQEEVICVIQTVSFKGEDSIIPESIEGKIVQDADRLDAIGAIGIARTFAFGGSRGRKIYDPMIRPIEHLRKEMYENHEDTSVNHFYEKLFRLKDMLNTNIAKELASERDAFMHKFLETFYNEWNGMA